MIQNFPAAVSVTLKRPGSLESAIDKELIDLSEAMSVLLDVVTTYTFTIALIGSGNWAWWVWDDRYFSGAKYRRQIEDVAKKECLCTSIVRFT